MMSVTNKTLDILNATESFHFKMINFYYEKFTSLKNIGGIEDLKEADRITFREKKSNIKHQNGEHRSERQFTASATMKGLEELGLQVAAQNLGEACVCTEVDLSLRSMVEKERRKYEEN